MTRTVYAPTIGAGWLAVARLIIAEGIAGRYDGRLRLDPASRSATITMLQPRTDAAYIPCVSLLDFWLPDGAVELVDYAHSIDFGASTALTSGPRATAT
jgi:hypothetical protein